VSADHDIDELLDSMGYSLAESRALARGHLESLNLTRAGKKRISNEKLESVRAALSTRFAVLCADPECARQAAKGREVIRAEPLSACEHCHGSDNRKAFARLTALTRRRHISKLVVVGGSPSVREELKSGAPTEWNLRLIDGTERRTGAQAQTDLEWADLVLVWGGSELDHKVSKLYTDAQGTLRKKLVQVSRRGVAALLNAAADHLER
jgi:hypothetical protein